jgi:hypothetical protein
MLYVWMHTEQQCNRQAQVLAWQLAVVLGLGIVFTVVRPGKRPTYLIDFYCLRPPNRCPALPEMSDITYSPVAEHMNNSDACPAARVSCWQVIRKLIDLLYRSCQREKLSTYCHTGHTFLPDCQSSNMLYNQNSRV